MYTSIIPKLPMRNMALTKAYYLTQLNFFELGDYGDYLIVGKDQIEIHLFEFKRLDPNINYGQAYIRTNNIDQIYKEFLQRNVAIHPNGELNIKPWGQKEFSLLDPDHNLLTFGQSICL